MSSKRVEAESVASSMDPLTAQLPWAIMRQRMTAHWRLSSDELDAALLLALPHVAPPADLYPAARAIAAETKNWANEYLGEGTTDDLLSQRKLFRAVYCDWPDLMHVLLTLAAHHARLFFGPGDDLSLIESTRLTYAPVARMLGLLRLRSAWIEEITRRSEPEGYEGAARELSVMPWIDPQDSGGSDTLDDRLVAAQREWAKDSSGKLPTAYLLDFDTRLRVFNQLRRELDAALVEEFPAGPRPKLELMPLMPGITLDYAHKEGVDLKQWLHSLPQLHMTIYCASEPDCYRALGVFHRIAQPIRPSDGIRYRNFSDHIARPQYNGYRALQTTSQWPDRRDARLVRCHILTREMKDLNEWGVMSAGAAAGGARLGIRRALENHPAWLDMHGCTTVADYLRRYDFTANSDLTYCFTPLGEIFWLDQGSLPLDFVYRLHTELGHQAASIEVNGRPADLNKPLANGDLVNVTLDPAAAMLDFDWLGKVTHKNPRRAIHSELSYRANSIHPGRGTFEKKLISLISIYKRDVHTREVRAKQDADRSATMDEKINGVREAARKREKEARAVTAIIPTTAEINHFLRRAALGAQAGDLQRLHELMAGDEHVAERLVRRLISEKITRSLRPTDGGAVGSPSEIRLCEFCRPIGNPIRVLLSNSHAKGDVVTVHRPECRHTPRDAQVNSLEWVEKDKPDDWSLYRFDVSAPDADGLLARLLEIVRSMPNAYVFRVEASVSELHLAHIKLDISLRQPQMRVDLKRLLEQTGAKVDYIYFPDEQRRSGVRPADQSRAFANPFIREHVTDWRFFGRDEEILLLTDWVYRKAADKPIMLLYGQRRVGKSSLVNRFAMKERLVEYPDRAVVPVIVDFRTSTLDHADSLATLLGQEINARLRLHYRQRQPGEDPMVWLNGLLLAAEAHLPNSRLLMIIDEFDADLDRLLVGGELQIAERRPRSLAALQAIMARHSFIRWLLVVQDLYLADPRIQAALPDLPYSYTTMHLHNLYPTPAHDLLRVLMKESGHHVEVDGLFDQVVEYSAGNPYFIHLIGKELIESASAGNRQQITEHDFWQAINVVWGRDGEFSHFTEHLPSDSLRRDLVTFVAAATELGESLPLAAIDEEMIRRRGWPGFEEVRRTVNMLERLGVLATTGDAPNDLARIPVPLFHQWIKVVWATQE